MATPVNTDPRWRRFVQQGTYLYPSDTLAGASIVVDPEISRIHDIVRLLELSSLSSYSIAPVLNAFPSLQPVTGDYWRTNVFTWDSRTAGSWTEADLFAENYERYNSDEWSQSLRVTPLHITTEDEKGNVFSFWNYLIFDPKTKRLDRLDPHSSIKVDLDTSIKNFLVKYGAGILKGYTYHTPQETGTKYQSLVNDVIIPIECPNFIHYSMWAYWLLYARLFFADHSQQDVYDGVYEGLLSEVNAGNLLLNFYEEFTVDANVHAFGTADFVISYPSAKDLWRYEPALMERTARLTNLTFRSTQLSRVLSAAVREYMLENEGATYEKLYRKYVGAVPPFTPKPYDCDGWVPVGDVDAALQKIFDGKELQLGYVLGAPYVFKDEEGRLTGFDYELGEAITQYINDFYGTELKHKPVDIAPEIHDLSEDQKFTTLNNALKEGKCHAALSGQLVLRGADLPDPANDYPEWGCTTALIFTAVTYTGKEDLDFSSLEPKTRQGLINHIVKHYPKTPLTFFSVSNPGPSYHSATDLVRDINAAGGSAMWVGGKESDAEGVIADATYHFAVGDSVASGYLALKHGKSKLYLNIPAVDSPSIYKAGNGESATLLPLAAFTLMES